MKPLRAFGIGIFLAGAAFGVQQYVVDKPEEAPVKQAKVATVNDEKLAVMQQKNEKLTAQVETLEKKLATQKEKAKKASEQAKAAKKEAQEAAEKTEAKKTTTATTKPASDHYKLTITSSMGSTEITKQLQQAGVISNAREFEQYIIAHNKATSLQNGTFNLKKGMSYEAILKEIAN